MTDQEKKILEMLDTATEEVEVPESLMPENIEKILETRKIKNWKRPYRYLLTAACAAIVIGVAAYTLENFDGTGDKFDGKKSMDSSTGDKTLSISNQLTSAESYEQVNEYISQYYGFMQREVYSESEMAKGTSLGMASEEKTSEMRDTGAGTEGAATMDLSGFSDTNVRTEGVGEADIVKTDGKYLYSLKENGNEIAIVDIKDDQMKEISVIQINVPADQTARISEFYIDDGKIFILTNYYAPMVDTGTASFYDDQCTRLDTYEISDITEPKLLGSVTQSGYYHTSRFVDGYLYIFSDFYVYDQCNKEDSDYYIPRINGKTLDASCIYLPPIHSANQYLVVTSVKASEPDTLADQKAVLSEGGQCYVSQNNIYIYEDTCCSNPLERGNLSNVNRTVIRKLSYKEGKLNGEAQGKVNGSLNDSFSIDEYDGKLRMVTTINGAADTTNAVYVLNEDLEIIGQIKDIAKGERVYSARFFGKMGYFVTYRETDPLFSVDFSDPEEPKIIGDLKIPGFSEYLHFYDDDLLLGIGMDTDEESGVTNGVKISMFDISDPADVKEVQKYTIPGAYYAEVFNDYRAVVIDKERNIIGFDTYGNTDMYYIFGYDETNGFNLEMEEEVNGSGGSSVRGVYVNDTFYVVKGNAIESYRIGSFEKIDDLLL